MTARYRQAPETAAAPAPPPANGCHAAAPAAPRWEEWFLAATPAQRAQALAMAREQGLIDLHQLPAVNGHGGRPRPAEPPQGTAAEAVARLLAGKPSDSPAAGAAVVVDFADTGLDPLQREAVRRALATPDLFLLQGLPGTGKSRVVAEILVQAGRRGWRTLFVSPRPAALDAALARVADRAELLPVRFLAEDESADALPRTLRALTLPQQQAAFRQRAVDGARQARAGAEEVCARRRRDEAHWPELRQLADESTRLRLEIQGVRDLAARVASDVTREAEGPPCATRGVPSGPFAAGLIEIARRHAAALAGLDGEQQAQREKATVGERELREIEAQAGLLAPRCEARRNGRWWSPTYWTAGSALAESAELESRREKAKARLADAEQQLAALARRREALDGQHRAERAELVRGEVERRRAEFGRQAAALEQQADELRRAFHERAASLEPAELRPPEATPDGVAAAYQAWKARAERDADECGFARQWAEYMEGTCEQLLPRLPSLANLLAGPLPALSRSKDFAAAAAGPFDLLVMDEAEDLTDSDVLRLAQRARRLLLVGDVFTDAEVETPASATGLRVRELAPACFAKLWRAAGGDLRELCYRWRREADGRLVCQLRPVSADDRKHLEPECLADSPDIELRILSRPKAPPALVEVGFPAAWTCGRATAFLWRELDELPLEPLGHTAWWAEEPGGWAWNLAAAPPPAVETVELSPGVRLSLTTEGRAASLYFARDYWNPADARSWAEDRLRWRDAGRTAYLQTVRRGDTSLGAVVAGLVFANAAPPDARADEAALEFVAVPPLRKAELPRDGAGLEQDLSASRLADRIPAEFRAALPRAGFANFLEAEAVVRRLEQLVLNPADAGENVALVALHAGQAPLVRQLVARSDLLRTAPFALTIGTPAELRHQEFDVVLVSLTRSHPHRSAPFAADPADLAVALTRARRRLILVGDLGAVVRRAHWTGPLDHQDARTAHVEQACLARLVRFLQPRLPSLVAAPVR